MLSELLYELERESVTTLPRADSTLVHQEKPAHSCGLKKRRGRLRERSTITHVVIHVIVGHYTGAIRHWQRGGSIKGCGKKWCNSPHYAISKDGEITQLVAEKYISCHGHGANDYGIGIEHDGFTKDPKYFTEEMYKASASLTRDICLRRNIPMTREHIIGHDEAPGTDHGDPGGYWDWDYYLALVNWDGDPATKPVRITVSHNPITVTASANWKLRSRPEVKHNPRPEHSYGRQFLRAKPSKSVEDAAVFFAEIPVAGTYDVSAWWPILKGNNPSVRFRVLVNGAEVLSTLVNQRDIRAKTRRTRALPFTPTWFSLGSITAEACDIVKVEVSRRSGSRGRISADAIRLLCSAPTRTRSRPASCVCRDTPAREAASPATHLEACSEPVSKPAGVPTPGRYYQIKWGDMLLGIAGKAYGVGPGRQRLAYARLINNASHNRRFWRMVEKERHLFPEGRISFNPRFTCDLNQQITAKNAVPKGSCYALIWIPPLPGKPVEQHTISRPRIQRPSRRPVLKRPLPRTRVRRSPTLVRLRRQPRRVVRRRPVRMQVRRPTVARRRRVRA